MSNNDIPKINKPKNIAMVAHDHEKKSLLEWAKQYSDILMQHHLFATGTTGKLLENALNVSVHKLKSGPLGGDLEVGALIAEGKIDMLIFFWDPLEPQPHDPDVKALLRIAAVWNIPVACNRASADFMINSPLVSQDYQRIIPNFDTYNARFNDGIVFNKT
jgi:methylglyoxal synthase